MRVIKKPGPVQACCLGEGSKLERRLLREGLIRLREDGLYEIFSREAVNGAGELAEEGDFVKLDGGGSPYPNRRAEFLRHHSRQGAGYIQKPVERLAWQRGEPVGEELRFLLDTGRLSLHEEEPARYFQACLWGAPLSAPADAVLVFHRIERDGAGAVRELSFNFVAREEFDRDYQLLPAGE